MRCPKCRPQPELDQASNGAATCPNCHGMWVPVGLLGSAVELDVAAASAAAARESTEDPDRRGGLCPDGHGLLARAKVEVDPPFFLERCPACEGLWFDAGELARVAAHHLETLLPELWDPNKRRERQKLQLDATEEARLAQEFGAETLTALRAIAQRFQAHPRKSQLVALFARELGA